ncbi:MAG: SDR family NAD(P)-dependent oxidoreductase [Saccharospirillaceae bacterium]|nr:SDR family NAD(P)-dependent oxidoreductase [Pseudomonadales bacterium]NRB79609.1 SDR family NAD(P)-dependent oxidoreductase [Saccharospirillaceae bacterium]
MKTILITGANSGLGKESARQFSKQEGVKTIYLACRNQDKANQAKLELEQSTGKTIFKVLNLDVSDPISARNLVNNLEEPINVLIMNAGGMGGKQSGLLNTNNVTNIFAQNILGHAVLVDELVKANKLLDVAMYAGSEAARGVKKMKMARPKLKNNSVDEFISVANGSFFNGQTDPMKTYGTVKYMGNLWMSSLARKHPHIRFVTMSPGATSGTNVMNDLSPVMRFMFKYVLMDLMTFLGQMHKVEVGAKRYVDAIYDKQFKSGFFYASKESSMTGKLVDQGSIFSDINDHTIQDNVYQAIHKLIDSINISK